MNRYLLSFFLLFSSLHAEFYLKGFGGANWMHVNSSHGIHLTLDPGWCADVAVGYSYKKIASLELEASHRANKMDHIRYRSYKLGISGHARTTAVLLNLIHEFDKGKFLVVPYIGAGAGVGVVKDRIHLIDASFEGSGKGFAWQALGGFLYPLTRHLDIGLEYRYFSSRAQASNQTLGLTLKLHQ